MNYMNLKSIQLLISTLVTVFLCLLPLIFHLNNAIAAVQSEKERTAMLIEGAKKEGKVVWYTTTPPDATTIYIKKFREKYPFIEVDILRSGDDSLLVKVMAEVQAKRNVFDVMQNSAIHTVILKDKGVFAKYLSPQREFYSKTLKDAEGYWTVVQFNLDTIGYNTKLVSPLEAPKSWDDLLDPKWKGAMGMDTKAYVWFASMLKMRGEEKGLEYMKKLSKQNVKFRTGKAIHCQMIAAGEQTIGVNLFNYGVEELKSRGASIEWVAFEPVVAEIFPLSISANAPHPNAARLLVDFMLSRDGQEALASTFRIPARTDVEAIVPKLKRGLKIFPVDLSMAYDYDRYKNLYQQILMKR